MQQVLQQILQLLADLDPDSRSRLLHTIATFYQLDLGGSARAPGSLQSRTSGPSFSQDRSLQPKDFLLDKNPKTDVERIACLAYYLTTFRDTPHFKTFDLSKLNTEAAQPKFANAANSVNNALKQGYLVQASKGQKQLSAAGERFVQALPDRDAAREAMALAKPRRKPRRQNPTEQNP